MTEPEKWREGTDGVHAVIIKAINPEWAEWAEKRIAELENAARLVFEAPTTILQDSALIALEVLVRNEEGKNG